MMDFLQRLAPPRDTDRSRAVAVLPSCFARETPLGETGIGQAAVLKDDTAVPNPPEHAAPDLAEVAKTVSSAAEAPGRIDAAPGQGQRARPLDETRQAAAAKQRRKGAVRVDNAAATFARHDGDAQDTAAPHPVIRANQPPVVSLPLSQRRLVRQNDPARSAPRTVHVTIGRIEVIATSAPAPAARRVPAPGKPSVSLADYLQSGKDRRP